MYNVEVSASAEKQIKSLPKKEQTRIFKRIYNLSNNPIPQGAKKLKGMDDLYRVRQGNWRIIYVIENKKLLVLVVKVGHRREVYQ